MTRPLLAILLCGTLALAQAPEVEEHHAPAPVVQAPPTKRGPAAGTSIPGTDVVEAAASGDAIRFLVALCVALVVAATSGWGFWFKGLATIETLRAEKAQVLIDEREKARIDKEQTRIAHEQTCATLRAHVEAVSTTLRGEAARALGEARQDAARAEAAASQKVDALRATHDQEIRRLYADQLTLSGRVADAIDRITDRPAG